MPKRILLLSAYDAVSHRLWRERLQALFPEYDWQQLSLPPRHFTWRIRGNSLQWALQQKTVLRQHYDLIIATSMVDLASLRGLIPQLGSIPTVVYFHENQFFYPPGQQPSTNIEPQLVPVYAALCADQVVFNSNFNRDTFLKGASSLFNKLPDDLGGAVDLALQSSCVIPVPLDDEEFETVAESEADSHETSLLQVVWNHRWEYDKGPELLLAVAEALLDEATSSSAGGFPHVFRFSRFTFRISDFRAKRRTSSCAIFRCSRAFILKIRRRARSFFFRTGL